jgi:hypothetical protein
VRWAAKKGRYENKAKVARRKAAKRKKVLFSLRPVLESISSNIQKPGNLKSG